MVISDKTLLGLALAASTRAYVPYSGFPVGAALLTVAGDVFTGCNIENSSFGLTICAERVALGNALAAGCREFTKIALAANCSPPPTPCGACRQVLFELAEGIDIISGNRQGEVACYRLSDLLPEPFSGSSLREFPGAPIIPDGVWRLPLIVRPVGYVSNCYSEPKAIPKDHKELISKVIIDSDYEDGLYRIEEEDRIAIIGYLHRAGNYNLIGERSGRRREVYGVFVCRSPYRPNSISHTEVDLISREGPVLTVRGLDLIDRTPVLDIKTILSSKAGD